MCHRYSSFHIGSQFCSACPWRIGTTRWRVDGDRLLFYWLNFVIAVRKIGRRLGCVNVRPTFSQWEREWSPSSTWNYVSTGKQQSILQLTTITKIAVLVTGTSRWFSIRTLESQIPSHQISEWLTHLYAVNITYRHVTFTWLGVSPRLSLA